MLTMSTKEDLLKLKLYGFIAEIESQEKTGGYEDMSFNDRLDLLVQRESLERDNKSLSKKILNAKFKHKASLEKLKISHSRGLDKSLIQTISSCDWVRKKINIIVTGPSGAGKSFLSCGIGVHEQIICREK